MASNPSTAVVARNRSLDAAFDGHSKYLRIYDGTQPATADTAITSQNKLVEVVFSTTSPFSSASSASKALAGTPYSAIATVGGSGNVVPTWWTIVDSDGTTRVHDNNVGASGSLVLANGVTQIVNGATVTISSVTITEP